MMYAYLTLAELISHLQGSAPSVMESCKKPVVIWSASWELLRASNKSMYIS